MASYKQHLLLDHTMPFLEEQRYRNRDVPYNNPANDLPQENNGNDCHQDAGINDKS